MKWFKHYADASRSSKLNMLRDKFGLEGYARYWLLVELLAEKFDGHSTKFEFHPRTLTQQLGYYRHTMAEQWLNYGQTLGLYNFDCAGDLWLIDFPKLLEIKDNHTNNLQAKSKSLAPREDKEKEKKNTSYSVAPVSYTPDQLVQLWNDTMPQHGFAYCRGLGSGKHLEKFMEAVRFMPQLEQWRELFAGCVGLPALNGSSKLGWRVSLTWLVDYDNALKVLNGNFSNEQQQGKSALDNWHEHGGSKDGT
jgi:hypothetical protein